MDLLLLVLLLLCLPLLLLLLLLRILLLLLRRLLLLQRRQLREGGGGGGWPTTASPTRQLIHAEENGFLVKGERGSCWTQAGPSTACTGGGDCIAKRGKRAPLE